MYLSGRSLCHLTETYRLRVDDDDILENLHRHSVEFDEHRGIHRSAKS